MNKTSKLTKNSYILSIVSKIPTLKSIALKRTLLSSCVTIHGWILGSPLLTLLRYYLKKDYICNDLHLVV